MAEDHVIPIHNHTSVPAPPWRGAQDAQSSLILRKVAQAADGWRMSHSRDGPRENLQVAMQVYRTEKRREALVGRRDGLEATVICGMVGQVEAACMAGHAVGLRPVSLRPSCQPVRTAQLQRRETSDGFWIGSDAEKQRIGRGREGSTGTGWDHRSGRPLLERGTNGGARVGSSGGSCLCCLCCPGVLTGAPRAR
ncbi:hypothetical protein F5Y08DRAFT_234173 [Xylaria arbuscula]|nr:hypothetical protein F5Y08DRAFT_234173 [Xylaria arbuscula]